jgi:serine/threonine protein kinase
MEGLKIGSFRITRKIGAGGMAEVYEAKHELMNRFAAVKLLRPEMSAREIIVRRFFQEAQAAASIEHPGIVHVYDVGYTVDGRAYLVMELLSGETLSQRMQRHQRLSLDATVTVIRQLAGVMSTAHQRGIIHRDLKPDNIFLVPDPEMPQGERVKVLDFGLAKLLEVAFPNVDLTAQGSVFGTPAYMAPEQCRSSGDVDQRADLYAIGCIFYMCLCGRAPFGTGGIEVLLAHVGQEPVPPRRHAPNIPPAIEELILQLLAKDRDRRLPSCETFIAQLDRVVETLPDVFPRGGRSQNDELTMRDNPTLQGALAFAVRHEPGARVSADRAPALPGTTRERDDSPAQPRRARSAPLAEPTQHLTTQALVPLDVDEDTDRISVPAGAGPLPMQARNGRDDRDADRDNIEQLSEDAFEAVDETEQVHGSSRKTAPVTARASTHERPTERLSAQSLRPESETRPMRKQERGAMAQTMRMSPRAQSEMAQTQRTPPGSDIPPGEPPRALPGVPDPVAGPRRALPGVPELAAEPPVMPPIAQPAPATSMRAPAQAMQLTALPWQPGDGLDGGRQQPAESAGGGEKASRASTPTLSNGELEHRSRREPPRRTDRRPLWAMAGLVCLSGLVAAGLFLGQSKDEPPVLEATEHAADQPQTMEQPPAANPEQDARREKIDALLQQAEQAMAKRDWEEARKRLGEAHAIEGIDEQRIAQLDEMVIRMGAEKESQKAFERLRTAAAKQRIEDVIEALGQIPETSAFRAEAHAAALETVRARAQRLLRRGDCKALASLVALAVRALPEVQDELQKQSATCEQAPAADPPATVSGKRDAKTILDEAKDAHKRNLFLSASRLCQELRKLGQVNADAATLCGVVACKNKDGQTAKWYYNRPLGPQPRTLIAQTCLKEFRFDVQK